MNHMVQRWNMTYEIVLQLAKEKAHVRELALLLKIPHPTLSRKLIELRNNNFIDYKAEGKNKVYFIKKNISTMKMLVNAENDKLMKAMSEHKILSPIVEDILMKCKSPLIILFGSYAKGIPKEESDIDLFIESKDPAIKAVIENIHPSLRVKTGVFNKNDLLIREIIKNHIIIKGAEIYYERLGFFE